MQTSIEKKKKKSKTAVVKNLSGCSRIISIQCKQKQKQQQQKKKTTTLKVRGNQKNIIAKTPVSICPSVHVSGLGLGLVRLEF